MSSESSLFSLDNKYKKSLPPPVNQTSPKKSNLPTRQNTSPIFYLSSEDQHRSEVLKDSSEKANTGHKEADKMRGTSLRNGGRPANSMEQDSFDSFDDMEDMLVVSTTNSLNLNNPNMR